MSAVDVTLTHALSLLRNKWAIVTKGLLRGEYALWLGSAISQDIVPNVKALLHDLLVKLYENIVPSNPSCPYRQKLNEIINMSGWKHVDLSIHPRLWNNDDRENLLNGLWDKYANVLDLEVRVNGTCKTIRWDILELDKKYSDPSLSPDAEHRFLAILVQEGVVAQMVTTNWDALIEIADESCSLGAIPKIKVVAHNDDLDTQDNCTKARLLKIHGCARKTAQNPSKYRRFWVANQSDITRLIADHFYDPLKEAARTLLRERRAFFIGLSGQDFDLQVEFVSAALNRSSFDLNPPRVIFSVPDLQEQQRYILKAIYGEDIYQNNCDVIEDLAALPLYAKPLLGSLYVLTLLEKFSLILNRGAESLKDEQRTLVEKSIIKFEEILCNRYNAIIDPNTRWRKLSQELPYFVSRFMSLYREQQLPITDEEYHKLCSQNLEAIKTDPDIPLLNFHWVLFTIALFLEGVQRSLWTLNVPTERGGENGQLIINLAGHPIKVFVLYNTDTGRAKLMRENFLKSNCVAGTVIVYPHGHRPPIRVTSPHRSLPVSLLSDDHIEIWLQDLVHEKMTPDELIDALRDELLAVGFA